MYILYTFLYIFYCNMKKAFTLVEVLIVIIIIGIIIAALIPKLYESQEESTSKVYDL